MNQHPSSPARRARALTLGGLLALVASQGLVAQNDAVDVVKKIASEVESEMKQIDQLLQQSSRPQGKSSEAARELVGRSQESIEKVVRGMDRMIDELQKMAQQGQRQSGQNRPSNQQDQQQQDQQQGQQGQPQEGQGQPQGQGRPQGGQGQREEIQTPELAEREGQGQQPQGQGQQGQEQGQPGQQQPGQTNPQGTQPQDGPAGARDPGQNRTGGNPLESPTERAERAIEDGGWGELQRYVPPDHLRAGVPEVPSRYRRLHEAFQRRTQKTGPKR